MLHYSLLTLFEPENGKVKVFSITQGTVKLGYNEHSVITNKMFSPKLPYYYTKQPGYNEPRL